MYETYPKKGQTDSKHNTADETVKAGWGSNDAGRTHYPSKGVSKVSTIDTKGREAKGNGAGKPGRTYGTSSPKTRGFGTGA